MILRHDAVRKDFLREIENKKIFCYGAGQVFKDFLQVYDLLDITAVVDINLSKQGINITQKGVPVVSLDTFLNLCDENSVLIITCFDYQQIEKELNEYDQLGNLPCYVYCMMQGLYDAKDDGLISDKYQITEFKMQDYNAGQKAPADVAAIVAKAGYKTLTINRGTQRFGKRQTQSEWKRVADSVAANGTLIIQLPLVDSSDGVNQLYELKENKNVKIIAIVHDVDILRGEKQDYHNKQYQILKNLADVWVVHNEHMIDELCKLGFERSRMVSLEIFDYLIDDYQGAKSGDGIIIAGNLDKIKAGYVYELNRVHDTRFNLFGPNYSSEICSEKLFYYGTFLPDDLINNLQGKYGLVWDGDSIETCSGGKGEYLRINNPHKLSLYLAVGIPVIIWEEAAEAEFVLNENVGITVKSLYELPNKLATISDDEYEKMKYNAETVGKRLRGGEYMTNAIKKAERIIQDMRDNKY